MSDELNHEVVFLPAEAGALCRERTRRYFITAHEMDFQGKVKGKGRLETFDGFIGNVC